MTKVRILVNRLMTEKGLYRNGEIVDFDDEKIKRLGSSVIRIESPITENRTPTKPDIIPKELKPKPEPKKETKKKPIKEDKEEKSETEINLPPRRKTKPQSGK